MTFSLKPLVTVAGRVAASVAAAARGAVHSVRFWVLAIFAVIVVILAYYVVADRHAPLTTDAYLQAYVVQVAPQVGGQVVHVHVHEGDRVAKGSLLFELDARPFEHKIALLEAKLVEARQQVKRLDAEVKAAHAEHLRRQAEADYARVVFQQEKSIFDEKSTTYRKKLDAEQKHKCDGGGRAAVRAECPPGNRRARRQRWRGARAGGPGASAARRGQTQSRVHQRVRAVRRHHHRSAASRRCVCARRPGGARLHRYGRVDRRRQFSREQPGADDSPASPRWWRSRGSRVGCCRRRCARSAPASARGRACRRDCCRKSRIRRVGCRWRSGFRFASRSMTRPTSTCASA